jgi:two-component system invasion response regulator UvrY
LIGLGDKNSRYNVLFEAESGKQLQEKLHKGDLPDIILMDIDMPDLDGFETVSWLKQFFPGIQILVISMLETDEAVIRMLRMGVKGYLSKDIEVEDMHMALEAISNNGLYYSNFVADVISQISEPEKKEADSILFTETEREFIKHACTDLTYVQIADLMNVSPKTVDGYRDNLFKKLNVKSRVALAMYAVKTGVVKI